MPLSKVELQERIFVKTGKKFKSLTVCELRKKLGLKPLKKKPCKKAAAPKKCAKPSKPKCNKLRNAKPVTSKPKVSQETREKRMKACNETAGCTWKPRANSKGENIYGQCMYTNRMKKPVVPQVVCKDGKCAVQPPLVPPIDITKAQKVSENSDQQFFSPRGEKQNASATQKSTPSNKEIIDEFLRVLITPKEMILLDENDLKKIEENIGKTAPQHQKKAMEYLREQYKNTSNSTEIYEVLKQNIATNKFDLDTEVIPMLHVLMALLNYKRPQSTKKQPQELKLKEEEIDSLNQNENKAYISAIETLDDYGIPITYAALLRRFSYMLFEIDVIEDMTDEEKIKEENDIRNASKEIQKRAIDKGEYSIALANAMYGYDQVVDFLSNKLEVLAKLENLDPEEKEKWTDVISKIKNQEKLLDNYPYELFGENFEDIEMFVGDMEDINGRLPTEEEIKDFRQLNGF